MPKTKKTKITCDREEFITRADIGQPLDRNNRPAVGGLLADDEEFLEEFDDRGYVKRTRVKKNLPQ